MHLMYFFYIVLFLLVSPTSSTILQTKANSLVQIAGVEQNYFFDAVFEKASIAVTPQNKNSRTHSS